MKILKKTISENRRDWDTKLSSALWAFRTAYKVSTGLTPFKLVYGLEAIVPMEFVVPSLRVAMTEKLLPEDSVENRVDQLMQLEEDRIQSSYIASVIRNRRTDWVNRHQKQKIFKEQDLVLVYRSKLGKHPGKLRMRYIGPFKIFRDLGQGTFQLMDMQGNVVFKPINGFRLKKYLVAEADPQINCYLVQGVKGSNGNYFENILDVRLHAKIIMRPTCTFLSLESATCRVNCLCHSSCSQVCVSTIALAILRFALSSSISHSAMRSVASTPNTGKGKEVSLVHRLVCSKQIVSNIQSDSDSDDVEAYSTKPKVLRTMATYLMYPMVDFQTHLDIVDEQNAEWLKFLGLHEFAVLPWDTYAKNIYGPAQLTMLQSGERSTSPT